jgi:ABC-type glycerol-3-phosphate transport system substrate-binding protein
MARTRIGVAIATFTVAGIALAGCAGGGAQSAGDNTIDGEVAGDIKVVTWRTDLVEDGTFDKYAKEFQKTYPDVNVTFEGITDYAGEMLTRMSTTNYGDVIGIPAIAGVYLFILWRWAFGPADRALFGKMPSADEASLPNVGAPAR